MLSSAMKKSLIFLYHSGPGAQRVAYLSYQLKANLTCPLEHIFIVPIRAAYPRGEGDAHCQIVNAGELRDLLRSIGEHV